MWTADSIDSLVSLKRRIYLSAWPFGVAALLAAWLFKAVAGRTSAVEQLLFPVVSIYFAVFAIALWRWRSEKSLLLIERSLFVVVALTLLARYYDVLFLGNSSNHADALADLLYWFPLVYIIAHRTFNRHGNMVCLLFFAVLLSVGLVYVVRIFQFGNMNDAYVLIRFYLGNVVYIVLLVAVTLLKELYSRATHDAQNMMQLAHTDPTVGLPNRRQMQTLLRKELERAKRFDRAFSVVFFDLDQFKQINDVYGHELGDTVLRVVATLVKEHLRPSDEIGRWGGDEFLVLVPELDATSAAQMAERLRQIIRAHPIDGIGAASVSFGVAAYPRFDSEDDLLRAADRALARAKTKGKNRVETET